MTRILKSVSVVVVLALVLALVAVVPLPVTPAQAQAGNLTWAPMYIDGTADNILYIDCPEAVSFAWEDDDGTWFTANSYEGSSQEFNITFQNLDSASHDLDFSYDGDDDIAEEDVSMDPSSVTIPGGGTATVTFTLDLTDDATYPAVTSDDWYDYYYVDIDIDYDDSYVTYLEFYDYVIPTSVPVLPNVELYDVDFDDQEYDVYTMRNYFEIDGMDNLEDIEDSYYGDDFWDDSYVEEFYDEIGDSDSPWWNWDSSEMNILGDGSVRIIDHATLTGDLSDVTWDKTWLFTHDDWWVKTTNTFTNTGTEAVSFSMSYYVDNYANSGTGIMVPGVYDDWTLTDDIDPFEIAKNDMTQPVIYECDLTGDYSETTPGAFGAIVFDPLPEYNSVGVDPAASSGTAIYFEDEDYHYFYYRFDLDVGESVTIDPYYIFTGSCPDAEQYLMDAVGSILAPPPPPPPRAVGGTVYPINKASVLIPWLGLAFVLILAVGGGALALRKRRTQ